MNVLQYDIHHQAGRTPRPHTRKMLLPPHLVVLVPTACESNASTASSGQGMPPELAGCTHPRLSLPATRNSALTSDASRSTRSWCSHLRCGRRRALLAAEERVHLGQPRGDALGPLVRRARLRTGVALRQQAPGRVISDCHFAVQLNHFMPGFLSKSVAVFSKVTIGYNPSSSLTKRERSS